MDLPSRSDEIAHIKKRERAVGYALCYFDEHSSQFIFDDINRGLRSVEDMAEEFARFASRSSQSFKDSWRTFENGLRAEHNQG